MLRLKSILNNKGLIAIVDQCAFSGTNFLVTILLAHFMIPGEFGTLAGITLVAYLFVSASNAIFIQPFQVLLVHEINKGKYIAFNIYAQTILVTFFSLVAIATIRLTSTIIPQSVAFISLLLMFDTIRKILLAKDEPIQALILDSVVGVAQLTGIGLLSFFKIDLGSSLFVLAISYLLGTLTGWFLLKPSIRFDLPLWRGWIRLHVSQGKWLLITSATQWAAANLFIIMSGFYLGGSSLGAFRIVQSLFGVLNLAFQSYENYMIPKAVRLLQESSETTRRYLLKIGMRGAGLFSILLVFLFIYSDKIMILAGGTQYSAFGFVVRGMSVLYFVILIGYPVRMAIRILVMNKEFFSGYFASFIFSAISSWLLLEYYGLLGAIIGLIINQIIIVIIWQYYLIKKNFLLWKSSM